MIIVGVQLIEGSTDQNQQSGKLILNEKAIIFFPSSQQHKDIKLHGLSYDDDYRGNAVAATFSFGRIDIRFHEQFSSERVRTLWLEVISDERISFLQNWQVYYQGRRIII
jgi:hypothetical protein